MNYGLANIATIQGLLRKHNAIPLHQLGQHFLIDRSVVDDMVRLAHIDTGDILIEIGTGMGVVTQKLLEQMAAVEAKAGRNSDLVSLFGIELDRALVLIATTVLTDAGFKNFKILNKNVLDVEITTLLPKNAVYTVVSSLPYYLTTPIIKKLLLEEHRMPQRIVVLMQQEVAQRMTAQPPDMNFLAVRAPIDDVGRTVLRLAHEAFQQKRKQLHTTLVKRCNIEASLVAKTLEKAGVGPTARPENLTIEQWRQIAAIIAPDLPRAKSS
ncbi:MAG: Ribosomal RNA small subunit methyltransferase A [Parcubacteria group bacterium GW2011_GWA2_47_8]|nr:MAG: Ribosomal RNA small subunit methyltransferase A [Parcubacteria group bacterium GW2011_GWA2_47_8]